MKRSTFLGGALAAIFALAIATVSPAWAQAPFDPPGLDRAMAAKDFHVDGVMATDGVVGVGVGLTAGGQAAVVIMTESAGVGGLPRSLDGVPVLVEVTGKIYAIHHRNWHTGGGGEESPPPEGDPPADVDPCDSDPTKTCDRPVPIGVSTGNEGECSAGTIGARVKAGNDVYALSNNHVYALENDADIGSNVLQPGRYDTNCDGTGNAIGTLDDFERIFFDDATPNTIDAAIALSSTAALGYATPPDGYGAPSSMIVAEEVGQSVQKYGRTTALTKGTITMINATVRVGYSSGIARFVDQIIVQSNKPVIKAGDSGSLLVLDEEPNPRPVGLLFAGNRSGKLAVANRIDLVLGAFGVSIDDGS